MTTRTRKRNAKRTAATRSTNDDKRNGNGSGEPTSATALDWKRVAASLLLSRALDRREEEVLVPAGLITYQFSSRGHDLAQIILGEMITHPHDAAALYYRSRPFVLTQGLTPAEALKSTMGREGGISDGRDIGVVHNLPRRERGTVLPTSGDVGAQFTPAVGWAQAIRYRAEVMGDDAWRGAVAVALAGDAACATNGFWSALTIATTLKLPYLFFVEDNGYGISVTGDLQTPGGSIAENLRSFNDITVVSGSGTDPEETSRLIIDAVASIRAGNGPVLLHLTIPRLCGHSFADNQSYKSAEQVAAEKANDPLPRLKAYLEANGLLSATEWSALEEEAERIVDDAEAEARAAGTPPLERTHDNVFHTDGSPQATGGLLPELGDEAMRSRASTDTPTPDGPRMNLIDAVRRTLESELASNDRLLVFGEDVGMKGGVHGATVGMQMKFGAERVFDTSLNEEGIIGRAVGMAMAGLMPVPEIQFRKYADPAHEQISDCGTIRWRTANNFAAPLVVRMPVGFGKKTGDPWHSVSGEAIYAHLVGWRIAIPSNAQDAVGLLRTALRGNDPTMFFEHRALLDTREGRRPWPGDEFMIPFGKAEIVRTGSALTIVTWGEMVHKSLEAVERSGKDVEVIDLRTIVPWDRERVLESVRKTSRCIIVHEDSMTCGFGAEIGATIAQEAFSFLDAPVERLAPADIPIPYNLELMDHVVPSVERIAAAIERTIGF